MREKSCCLAKGMLESLVIWLLTGSFRRREFYYFNFFVDLWFCRAWNNRTFPTVKGVAAALFWACMSRIPPLSAHLVNDERTWFWMASTLPWVLYLGHVWHVCPMNALRLDVWSRWPGFGRISHLCVSPDKTPKAYWNSLIRKEN